MKKKTYLDECLARAKKAASGPWKAQKHGDYSSVAQVRGFGVAIDLFHDDAEFIAHARQDVPELVYRLKRAAETLSLTYDGLQNELGPGFRGDMRAIIVNVIQELEAPIKGEE